LSKFYKILQNSTRNDYVNFAAGINDILAEDNVMNRTGSGLRCKSAQGIGAAHTDIHFNNVSFANTLGLA